MHARALADMAPLVDSNNSGSTKNQVVVRVRETRVTGILIHVLIALVVTLWSNLFNNIPIAVLSGLFLFCAVNTLQDNSLYERVLLLFTEQASLNKNHIDVDWIKLYYFIFHRVHIHQTIIYDIVPNGSYITLPELNWFN